MKRRHEMKKAHDAGARDTNYNSENVAAFMADEEEMQKRVQRKERLAKWTNNGVQDMCSCCAWPNAMRSFGSASLMEVMHYAQSGDIVLFDNKCNLCTCLISAFTRSDWDHVGIVIRKPKSKGGKPHEVYLLEALSPKVLMDPLNLVMDWVIGDDGEGAMYWRPIVHPGEKTERYPHGKISDEMEEYLWDQAENKQKV